MNADPEDDAAVLGHAGVAFDHGVLNFDGAANGVDDAAELDDRAVAGALDHAPMMHGDGRVDQVAAQRSQPRQDAILVRAGKPGVADHIRAKIAASLRVSAIGASVARRLAQIRQRRAVAKGLAVERLDRRRASERALTSGPMGR